MNANNLRLGFTESTMLYIYYITIINKEVHYDNAEFSELNILTQKLITWFYCSSGYYNKNDDLKNMNFETIHSNENYINYMNKLIHAIQNSESSCILLHKIPNYYAQFLNDFNNYFNNKIIFMGPNDGFNYDLKYFENLHNNINVINDSRNILVINPLANLFVSQFKNKNIYNVNRLQNYNISDKIINMIAIENASTFENNGPDTNNLETFEKLCKKILELDIEYDTAVISCGSYSLLIADFIFQLHKNVIVLGGAEINELFGIKNQRCKEHNPNFIFNKYWIDVPEELKPKNYKKIENGCYW
jgi:hypothetical protein